MEKNTRTDLPGKSITGTGRQRITNIPSLYRLCVNKIATEVMNNRQDYNWIVTTVNGGMNVMYTAKIPDIMNNIPDDKILMDMIWEIQHLREKQYMINMERAISAPKYMDHYNLLNKAKKNFEDTRIILSVGEL